MLEEWTEVQISWLNLQQPSHASIGVSGHLQTLLVALNQGWSVEEPVEVMPIAGEDLWVYCFVIRNAPQAPSKRLYISATPEMERFVEQSRYQVIEGSYIESL